VLPQAAARIINPVLTINKIMSFLTLKVFMVFLLN